MISSLWSFVKRAALRVRRRSTVFALRRAWATWLREAPAFAGRKVCLLACHSTDGRLSQHTLHLANAWSSHGYLVVLIVATDEPEHSHRNHRPAADALAGVAGLLVRANVGYDFGSWATALRLRADLADAALLVATNDSAYGPLDGFGAMLARAEASTADVVALIDSHEIRHHVQSLLMFYRPRALHDRTFRRFWATIGAFDRRAAIEEAELRQLAVLRRAGLSVDTLFPAPPTPPINRTLNDWKGLVAAGFPFVKAELLRTNPRDADLAGWASFLAAHGYDAALVRLHLGAGFDASAAGRHRERDDADPPPTHPPPPLPLSESR